MLLVTCDGRGCSVVVDVVVAVVGVFVPCVFPSLLPVCWLVLALYLSFLLSPLLCLVVPSCRRECDIDERNRRDSTSLLVV